MARARAARSSAAGIAQSAGMGNIPDSFGNRHRQACKKLQEINIKDLFSRPVSYFFTFYFKFFFPFFFSFFQKPKFIYHKTQGFVWQLQRLL
jgi:hypothetical protein